MPDGYEGRVAEPLDRQKRVDIRLSGTRGIPNAYRLDEQTARSECKGI